MKYTFSTMATPGMGLKEVVELAGKYNFDGVDIRVRDNGGDVNESMTSEEIANLKSLFSDGVELLSIMCYNKTIEEEKDEILNSILKCVEIGKILNVPFIRIFSGRLDNDEKLHKMADVLNKVFASYDEDISLCIQNHRVNGVSCEEAVQLKKLISDERFGIILSPEHEYIMGNDYLKEAEKVLDITKLIYIADCDKDGKLCLIGEGVIDFNKVMEMLKNKGFDGNVSLKWEKCWHEELPECEIAFEGFNKYFKRV